MLRLLQIKTLCLVLTAACGQQQVNSDALLTNIKISKVGKIPPVCGVFANYLEVESKDYRFALFCPEIALLEPISVGDFCDIRGGLPELAVENNIQLTHVEVREAQCGGKLVYDGSRVYGEE